MIVFNTTFHVEEEIHEAFIEYMLQRFIPMSTKVDCSRHHVWHAYLGMRTTKDTLMRWSLLLPTLQRWNDGKPTKVTQYMHLFWKSLRRS